ncbi:phosphorylase family protein [Lichenicoccus roseus]|uniref:Nucleoside phosphorylase domain-containing protein n=1 Tax=Lichenicoccus roseus TaxID=2683649 RepID=A0A5R9JCR8_9PROT|nr:hypothetical protein [Lichenicoccus roseus]TLU72078.1 hypothetical protein FE263_13215 [Lichenicoccus roseus]
MSSSASDRIGFLVGLSAEARLLRPLGAGVAVEVSGATAQGAQAAVVRLIAAGAGALVSFGIAAGLDPDLRPGTVLVPSRIVVPGAGGMTDYFTNLALCARLGGVTRGALLHSDSAVDTPDEKRARFEASQCVALDMESGILAEAASRAGLPFAALRAVCDPAGSGLPPAALVALGSDGRMLPGAIARSLLRRPYQVPALVGLGYHAALARRALKARIPHIRIA